ncbi:MAG: YkgJ family cysteine cluster protein [Parvularculaceae bacterium]|nr:YkgJ family cysteine cluster protein [Parvularculaceae bacterium]
MVKKLYNCLNCPAYCCSYALIPVTDFDLKRLAKHFGISVKTAERKYTKYGDAEYPRVLRHAADEHFKSACMFLDQETRRCTVYEGRPRICRDFPTQSRCGYYEFLKFERDVQDDRDWVATTN